eukprot:gene3092-3802_t
MKSFTKADVSDDDNNEMRDVIDSCLTLSHIAYLQAEFTSQLFVHEFTAVQEAQQRDAMHQRDEVVYNLARFLRDEGALRSLDCIRDLPSVVSALPNHGSVPFEISQNSALFDTSPKDINNNNVLANSFSLYSTSPRAAGGDMNSARGKKRSSSPVEEGMWSGEASPRVREGGNAVPPAQESYYPAGTATGFQRDALASTMSHTANNNFSLLEASANVTVLSYTERSAIRSSVRRLLEFTRCSDFMLTSALYAGVENSLRAFLELVRFRSSIPRSQFVGLPDEGSAAGDQDNSESISAKAVVGSSSGTYQSSLSNSVGNANGAVG